LLAAIGLAIGRIVGAAMATLSIQMLAPLFSAPPNSWTSPPWAQRPVSPS
jgi:predicted lysophospholipase L1 biosynthesis ABC-type transport system permease subunit